MIDNVNETAPRLSGISWVCSTNSSIFLCRPLHQRCRYALVQAVGTSAAAHDHHCNYTLVVTLVTEPLLYS